MEAIWGFQFNDLSGGRTRLVASGYQTFRPCWIERFVSDRLLFPTAWIVQACMLAVLKRNIERATSVQLHMVGLGKVARLDNGSCWLLNKRWMAP